MLLSLTKEERSSSFLISVTKQNTNMNTYPISDALSMADGAITTYRGQINDLNLRRDKGQAEVGNLRLALRGIGKQLAIALLPDLEDATIAAAVEKLGMPSLLTSKA